MRRGKLIGLVASGAMLLSGVGTAAAATPAEIYADLADNGCLNGTYTQAELDAYARSATVQGYGSQVLVVRLCPPPQPPAVKSNVAGKQTNAGNKQTPAQVAGVQTAAKPISQTPPQVAGVQTPPVAETGTVETLPFTGSELGLFALVGGALLLGGLALRASARRR